jgi:predicted amidohydrolase
MLRVAAIQYCAGDNAKDTLAHIQPLIAEAASRATLVTLPECASYLAASREQLATHAEWEDDSYSQNWLADQAQQLGIWLLAGSLMIRRRDDHKLVNRSLLFGPDGGLSQAMTKSICLTLMLAITKAIVNRPALPQVQRRSLP